MKYIVVDARGRGYLLGPFDNAQGPLVLLYTTQKQGATVFSKRQQANTAIRNSLKHSDRGGWGWRADEYQIVSIQDEPV